MRKIITILAACAAVSPMAYAHHLQPDSIAIKQGFEIAPGENDWLYDYQSPVIIDFTAINPTEADSNSEYALTLTTDTHHHINDYKKTLSLSAGASKDESFDLGLLEPGFYTLTLKKEGAQEKTFNIGVNPELVISAPDRQADFQEFWDRARQELAAIDPDYKIELLPDHSNEVGNAYKVTMNSLDGHRLLCFLSVPKKEGRYPVNIFFCGYSSSCWIPATSEDICTLTVSTRGQGEWEDNIYGDWIRYNIDNPEKYYYRGAYMDCVRAIDFAAQCPWIDPSRMIAMGGSQGGALTLAAASLDGRLCAIAPDVPFLGDFPDYFQIVDWPASAVFEAQKAAGLSDEELYRNLSYFDIKNLTPWITCPVVMAFGLQDPTCPPHTNFASFNNIPHDNKKWYGFPLRGHDMWLEPGWEPLRSEFLAPYYKK